MKKEDLDLLKEKISKLSEVDKKNRRIYLRGLANGEIAGPPTGYSSIDEPWLKYYSIDAIKADIPNIKAYDLIYNKYKDNKELIAINYLGKKISYHKLFTEIEKVSKSLKSIGVKKGDIVLMAMPTTPEMIYIFYALNRIGAITDTVDPRIKSDRYKEIIHETQSKYIISVDLCRQVIDEFINEENLSKVVMVSPIESLSLPIKAISKIKTSKQPKVANNKIINWSQFIKLGNNYNGEIDCQYEKNMPVVIVHTGGTTGTPKGVVLTNENFNTMAITQEVSEYNQSEKDKFLTFLPPFIAYCLVNAIHDPLYLGFENILVPKFDAKDFPSLMYKYKPNHVLAGPILWDYFIKDKRIQKEDLSYLKSPISGGDVLNIELERSINEFFKNHNCNIPIAQGYGLTEVSAAAIYSKPSAYKEGHVGIPYVKNNLSVFVPNTEEELEVGKEGEIYISTPTLMKEYFNNKQATNDVITVHKDGQSWIRTGDLGVIDQDGSLKVNGRIKRLIVRNGNKIFPSSVEDIIRQNKLISGISIVAMPDKKERNVPIAYITLNEENYGCEQEVINSIEESIKEKLPEFNIPTKYVFKTELPLTNINKIDFKKLEEESLAYLDSDKIIINYDNNYTKARIKKL